MIRYTLKCEKEHSFDSWFQSAEAFDKLSMARLISCSVCGSEHIQKAVMAPGVRPGRKATSQAEAPARPLSAPASPAEQALKEGAVLDNHKWGYHGTYEKESFKQAQTSPFD